MPLTFETVLWLTSMPAIGNSVGALVAEWIPSNEKRLSLALHASAGVLLGVVAVELMPNAGCDCYLVPVVVLSSSAAVSG
jgi:hypothetical protein